MQNLNSINLLKNNSPSFGGLTRIFKARTFYQKKTYEHLAKMAKDTFIGSLPKEIITDIQKLASNKEEKVKHIKQIMQAFEKASYELNRPPQKEKPFLYQIINKLLKKQAQPHLSQEENAANILNQAFKKAGLIKESDTIEITKIGRGVSSNVYKIKFPQTSNYKDKAIKVYTKQTHKAIQEQRLSKKHGFMPETNAATLITQRQKHNKNKSPFVEFYLASLKNDFMLCEYVPNTPTSTASLLNINKLADQLHLTVMSLRRSDIVNNKIVDFGYIKNARTYSKISDRIHKKLSKQLELARKQNTLKEFFNKVHLLFQKTLKNQVAHAKDINQGINAFLYDCSNHVPLKIIKKITQQQ